MASTKHPTGYLALRSETDIQKALARRINRILMDRNADHHGGQLAALCNAWVNAAKFHMEVVEVRKLREDIDKMQEAMKQKGGGQR